MPAVTATRLERLHLVSPLSSPPDSPASPRAAGVGSVIETSFCMFAFLPARAHWISRVTEFEWNHYFADVRQKGPFKRWHHRHEFLAETRNEVNGTLVRDLIEYEVGFGPLGAVANWFFVAPQLRHVFGQRQQILPGLLS